jgi:hypothetical protein
MSNRCIDTSEFHEFDTDTEQDARLSVILAPFGRNEVAPDLIKSWFGDRIWFRCVKCGYYVDIRDFTRGS